MQLVLGDYIKKNPHEADVVSQAMELINWFNNHPCALALLFQEQCSYPEFSCVLMLLKPCLTWWGSHSLALTRLLKLKLPFQTLATKYARGDGINQDLLIAGGDPHDQVEKACRVVEGTIRSELFWEKLDQ